MRARVGTLITLGFAAAMAAAQTPVPGRIPERLPGELQLPNHLRPPSGLPYLDPRERQALRCLSKLYSERGFYGGVYGDEPVPSVPNASSNCRLTAVIGVVNKFRPPADPPNLTLHSGDVGAMTAEELRTYLRRVADEASVWNEIITLERTVGARFGTMDGARARLIDKLRRLANVPVEKWHGHWAGFALQNAQCFGDSPDEQEEATAKILADYEPFTFYPDYRELLFGVSLQGEEVIPEGVAFCEKGADQKACFTPRPRDWSAPGCWDRVSPNQYRNVQCADGSARTRIRERGGGSGCDVDLQGVLPPFFAEGSKTVEWRKKELQYQKDIEQFLASLDELGTSISTAAPVFVQARTAAIARVLPQYRQLEAHLEVETDSLGREAEGIRIERDAIDQLRATIAARNVKLAELKKTIEATSKALTQADDALSRVRTSKAEATDALAESRSALDAARKERSAVKLECGGASYGECQDEAAKLKYDEQLYLVMQKLDETMEGWAEALDALTTAIDAELKAVHDTTRLQGELATSRISQASEHIDQVRDEAAEAVRTAAVEARQAIYDRLKRGHDADAERLALYLSEVGG